MKKPAAVALVLTVLSSAALADEPGTVVYHCDNTVDGVSFALTYELRGDRISKVSVGGYGMPRLGSDLETRWKAKFSGDDVEFSFEERKDGVQRTGGMTLVAAEQPGHFTLKWSSTLIGGHIVMEDEPREADCVFPDFEKGESL